MSTIFHFSQLILVKVKANLQAEAACNYLSYLWWIFEPILHMFVFYLVFGFLLQQGTEDFVAFLLTGLIPWLWFNKTISNSMMSIVQGKGLMMQVHLPKIILPTIVIFQDVVKQMVVIILLLFFLIIYGVSPSPYWFALPSLLITEILLISACSYIVAAVIPFLPDLSYLVRACLQMLMFGSGIFYSSDMIPTSYHRLFYLNPMASLLASYRGILLYNKWPDWQDLFFIVGGSLTVILIMILVLRKLDHVYPRVVL
ncbi:MAG: ABC transporter permease [Desulfobulbaceae bacterium]|uniref:Transport permease protein n=1 Tax=Candidatus Desulfobia pelagia TaxID=2841692 RepID=A0A8J6NGR7_9BACT|nr:ABC transporter permease [Candidatus Desulfobia pelagia]